MCLDSYARSENLIEYNVKLSRKSLHVKLTISTLICIISSCCLFSKLIHKNTDNLLIDLLCTVPTLSYMTWTWCSYFYEVKENQLNNNEY